MNPALKLAPRTFPARIAELGFTAVLPEGWISHELPNEDPDFSNPTLFVPLAIVTAPHAAIVFAFAARPAYDDGTLQDWAWYHLNNNQIQPRAVGRDVVTNVAAVSGEATQQSEVGPLVVRFAFFEDGGRLVNLTLTAPELLADTVRDAWFAMLKSFRLETPRGSRFAIEDHPDNAPRPPEPGRAPAPVVPEISMTLPAEVKPKKSKFYDFALADDTESLDQEKALNANFRDKGIGLVPNVVAVRKEARYASVAAAAIMAQFDVPFGWYVSDDGKRTLVFEPSGKVQISLNLLPTEGKSRKAILDEIETQMRSEYPNPEFVRLREGRVHGLGARNIADGPQPLEQYHMLYPFRDETMVLRARVTATPEEATDACNLAQLILDSCAFDSFQQRDEPKEVNDGQPAWWKKALALEAQNELEAAEKVIHDGCQHIGAAASTAEMYRLRMCRLLEAGDREGAKEAFKKSSDFISFYASCATSGGEGAALSLERDRFRAELVSEFGSDPEAVNT